MNLAKILSFQVIFRDLGWIFIDLCVENPFLATLGGYGGLIRTLMQELPAVSDRTADGGSKWQKSTKARLTALSAKRSAPLKDM